MQFIFVAIILSFLVFMRVYGPHLITALFQEWQEKQKRAVLEQHAREDDASAREIVSLNEQLSRAFGGRDESRKIEESLRFIKTMRDAAKRWQDREVDEDAPTDLYLDVVWLDDEIDVIMEDKKLTPAQKCEQVIRILDRG